MSDHDVTGLKEMGPFEMTVQFDNRELRLNCPYQSCRQCGGCAVCGDFHGDVYGGCNDDCPYRPWHRWRDTIRRLWARLRGQQLGWIPVDTPADEGPHTP